MFIIELTYKAGLREIDLHIEEHKLFLKMQYQAGSFVASGRKEPRTGGIILCVAASLQQVWNMIAMDPFHIHKLADYRIVEFIPTMYQPGFEPFVSNPGLTENKAQK